jgi:hypothetical protein
MADENVAEVEHVADANGAEVQFGRIETLPRFVRAVVDSFCVHNLDISALEVRQMLNELAEDAFVGAEG